MGSFFLPTSTILCSLSYFAIVLGFVVLKSSTRLCLQLSQYITVANIKPTTSREDFCNNLVIISKIWVTAYIEIMINHRLRTSGVVLLRPTVVFGIPDTLIRVWEIIPDIEVMINNIRWRWPKPMVRKVWVDSGGYQIMIKRMNINIDDIMNKYRKIDGDVFISLDIPPQELCTADRELVLQNIKNFEILYEKIEGKKIVPVVHCYESELLLRSIDVYKSYNVDLIAFGGAVPPSMARMGKGSRTLPLMALAITRKAFNKWIHALGIGGTPAIYKALSIMKINSLDSSSWRTKAAYGKIMIPGLGERYVGNGHAKFGRKDLSDDEYKILEESLRRTDFPYVDKLRGLLSTFRGRAIVNAWVMKNFIDVIYSNNGFKWLLKYASTYVSLDLEELLSLMDRKLRKYRRDKL